MKTNIAMKRMIAILVLICLAMGIVPTDSASAADNKPGTPSISVKLVNGTDAKITIGKTSGAKGYDVFITTDVDYMGYKVKNISTDYYYNSDSSGEYIHAATIKKDGSTSRTITIKNLPKGKILVKVRAFGYETNQWGFETVVYSKFSKSKSISIKKANNGYKNSYNFTNVKKGDSIKFGSYEQDFPIDGKDPIEWIVLNKTKDSILVMSKYVLDCVP